MVINGIFIFVILLPLINPNSACPASWKNIIRLRKKGIPKTRNILFSVKKETKYDTADDENAKAFRYLFFNRYLTLSAHWFDPLLLCYLWDHLNTILRCLPAPLKTIVQGYVHLHRTAIVSDI